MENDGDLSWVCTVCHEQHGIKKAEQIHPYTTKLLNTKRLQDAGYPLAANDLTLEEWYDLSFVKDKLTQPQGQK